MAGVDVRYKQFAARIESTFAVSVGRICFTAGTRSVNNERPALHHIDDTVCCETPLFVLKVEMSVMDVLSEHK